MEGFGLKVHIKFSKSGLFKGREQVSRNVTEIHYNYQHSPAYNGLTHKELRVAFESDIHGTGVTYALSDIEEFEATVETEKATTF
jgi:hypothetical protein